MAKILKGAPAAKKISESVAERTKVLAAMGKVPTLAIVRVGDKADDVYYENAAVKKAETLGIYAIRVTLSESAGQDEFEKTVIKLNDDDSVDGVLILKPLPKHIDEKRISELLRQDKDVDGITPGSMYRLYANIDGGFAPCTARAALEVLKFYGIDITGKNVTVIGRSLVAGRPIAMLMLKENATVTLCHTKTENTAAITQCADIIITAAGKAGSLTGEMVSSGQTVIDVGMNSMPDGKMCGDAEFDDISEIVGAITPVPGGVGALTTALLLESTVSAAEKKLIR